MYVHCPLIFRIIKGLIIIPDAYYNIDLAFFYSLLHKKLRESNISLRRSIVERVLKLYHVTSRNLTLVNDNLSRAQGIVEVGRTRTRKKEVDSLIERGIN